MNIQLQVRTNEMVRGSREIQFNLSDNERRIGRVKAVFHVINDTVYGALRDFAPTSPESFKLRYEAISNFKGKEVVNLSINLDSNDMIVTNELLKGVVEFIQYNLERILQEKREF